MEWNASHFFLNILHGVECRFVIVCPTFSPPLLSRGSTLLLPSAHCQFGGLHCQSEGASWKASFKRATSAPYKSSVTLKVTFQYFIIWKMIIPSYASYSDKWEVSHQELFYLIITFPIKSTSLLLSQNKDIPNFKNLRKLNSLSYLCLLSSGPLMPRAVPALCDRILLY